MRVESEVGLAMGDEDGGLVRPLLDDRVQNRRFQPVFDRIGGFVQDQQVGVTQVS